MWECGGEGGSEMEGEENEARDKARRSKSCRLQTADCRPQTADCRAVRTLSKTLVRKWTRGKELGRSGND